MSDSNTEIPEDWPFDQAPNVAAVTTIHVMEKRLPILSVTHYEDDHSWAFVCGTTNEVRDGRVVAMKTILHIDPTVREIADLPPGYSASRKFVGDKWLSEKSND